MAPPKQLPTAQPEVRSDSELATRAATLQFWRNLEFFVPFSLRDVYDVHPEAIDIVAAAVRGGGAEEGRLTAAATGLDGGAPETADEVAPAATSSPPQLPWLNPHLFGLDPTYRYGFDLFVAPFELSQVIPLLKHRCGEGQWRRMTESPLESRAFAGLSCVARLSVAPEGWLLVGESSFSTLPWALSRLIRDEPLSMDGFYRHAFRALGPLESASLKSDEEGASTPELFSFEMLTGLIESLKDENPLVMCPGSVMAVAIPHRLGKALVTRNTASDTFPYEDVRPNGASDTAGIATAEPTSTELTPAASSRTPAITSDTKKLLRRKRRVDILNSFYLRDLGRVHDCVHSSLENAPVLRQYLSLEGELSQNIGPSSERVDLFDTTLWPQIADLTDRTTVFPGRWPAPHQQTLSRHQQLALSLLMKSDTSLISVNGPPGTGKTTMVRDLLAHLVVSRARVLAELRKPGEAFSGETVTGTVSGKESVCRVLDRRLRGWGLVLASPNNNAVENISLELPSSRSLGDGGAEFSFLRPIANRYHSLRFEQREGARRAGSREQSDARSGVGDVRAPFWGLPTVPLGKRGNRTIFRWSAFLPPADEDATARDARIALKRELTLFEWRKIAPEDAVSFQQAQRKFRDAWQRWSDLVRVDNHDLDRDGGLALRENERTDHLAWHEAREVTSPELNGARSALFGAALALQEAWVREVPLLERELMALSRLMLTPESCAPSIAEPLWELLFMIIPAISTTLASVERMFSPLSAGSLGFVVIDEAGQASPQSVVGLLMRAKKGLLIGDQRQLQPVVTIPEPLVAHFGDAVPNALVSRVSPLSSSALSLADRSARYGTMLADGFAPPLWLGIPLCVHRRCASPMFDLSNEIAYNGFMIQAQPREESHPILGPSGWFQVAGPATKKLWVPPQGLVVAELLTLVYGGNPWARYDEDTEGASARDLFIISPFRAVAHELIGLVSRVGKQLGLSQSELKMLRSRVGTIHTMQGKEAAMVVLVLGCDATTAGAASWAGESPNLLNVAITRARNLVYVIGDRDVWHNKGFFSDLQKRLPVRIL